MVPVRTHSLSKRGVCQDCSGREITLGASAYAGRQMFAEVVQPLLCHFTQGFNTTVSP